MRVGIIAEGRGDLAVIANIVKGCLGLERERITFLRPEYSMDQTDLHGQSEEQFSNWGHVRDECRSRTRIDDFLDSPLAEDRFVVIHIDTDVVEEPGFDVERPPREPHDEYVQTLRDRVARKLDEWLGPDIVRARFSYAIAVEQTDAWVLALHSAGGRPTSVERNPKKTLNDVLNRRLRPKELKKLFQLKTARRYDQLSKDLRKRKKLVACARRNISLGHFVAELQRRETTGDSPRSVE